MEMLAGLPEWLIWGAAGAVAVLALAVIAGTIDAALDLETS